MIRKPLETDEMSRMCASLQQIDSSTTAEVMRWLAGCPICARECPVRPQHAELTELQRRAQPPPIQ